MRHQWLEGKFDALISSLSLFWSAPFVCECFFSLWLTRGLSWLFVVGNLTVSAKCSACDKTCGSVLRLQDWRCLWCKAMVRAWTFYDTGTKNGGEKHFYWKMVNFTKKLWKNWKFLHIFYRKMVISNFFVKNLARMHVPCLALDYNDSSS